MFSLAPIRTVVAEGQRLVRSGLSALLSTDGDITVVGEAADRSQAITMVIDYRPHVLLLDPAMDAAAGLDLLVHLVRSAPSVRVLVVSERDEVHRASRALAAGAVGFLSKSASANDLRNAVRVVAQGKQYLDPCLPVGAVHHAVAQLLAAPSKSLLTLRQREVLKLIAGGSSNKEIASALQVSVKTVETHRAQVMQRLGVRDLPALVQYAIAEGLVRSVAGK